MTLIERIAGIDALVSIARRTPLIQPAVRALSEKGSLEQLNRALAKVVDEESHAATALAIAATLRSTTTTTTTPLDPAITLKLLPETSDPRLLGPLVFASSGDPVELLIRFLEDGAGSTEREAFAVLLASEILAQEGKTPPARLVSHGHALSLGMQGPKYLRSSWAPAWSG